MEKYYSIRQAVRELNALGIPLTRHTLTRNIENGRIATLKAGDRYLVKQSVLHAWAEVLHREELQSILEAKRTRGAA
jgi:excisionase family DNA binding protein